MNIRRFYIAKTIGFIIVVVLVGGFYMLNSYNKNEKQPDPHIETPNPHTPQQLTLTGTYMCLPHKNTNGPQTLECALGLKTDNGLYYALDFNSMPQTALDMPTGIRISVSGIFTPIERLSTDHWQKYPIVGIFSVTDSLEKL